MDLIYTDSQGQEIGIITSVDMDMSYGNDENDFELTVPMGVYSIEADSYIFINNTEYMGVVDIIKRDTKEEVVTYSGRTWHGILNAKVIAPSPSQDYYVVSGEAHTVIQQIISRLGLTDLFEASSDDSGVIIDNYQFARYIYGYSGLRKMLNTYSQKLIGRFDNSKGKMILSVSQIIDYSNDNEITSSQFEFVEEKNYRPINHLICLGQGELKNRVVIHLYADANGVISQTQTLFGLDERIAIYENNNDDAQALLEDGTEELAEYQLASNSEINFDNNDEIYDIDDIVETLDEEHNISVSERITQKIVNISNGLMTIECQIGTKMSSYSLNNSGGQASGGTSAVLGIKGSAETNYRIGKVTIYKANIGLGNVENKSSETIRNEITSYNVTHALGYTPPTATEVQNAIDEAVSSVYKPKGSKAVSELTSALLISSNKGNVYNMSTNGTTTADFVEGAGKEIKIGDNVVIVEVSQGVYKFDLLSGMVDLTNYYTRTDTDGLLNNKVDKVTGKGLSTNDYTTAEKTKLTSLNNNYFGTSTGQASLQNKAVVVSADQHFELKVGCVVAVKFDADNTYSATTSAPVTMNVNNTGAKQIYINNTATPTGASKVSFGAANHHINYMYDGTYWVWVGHGSDNNTTYSAMSVNELTTGTATAQRVVRADYLKQGIEALSTAYGTCSTEAATPEKIVTLVDSNWKLRTGATITVKFSYTNTATNPTLNVNNSGAKSMWYGSAILTKGWGAGSANVVTTFVYDGTYWVWTGHGIDTNTTYSAMSVNELTTGTATTLRTMRADYLKQGIDSLISTALQILNGGATDQVLTKNSNADLDFKWTTGGGGGGGVTPSHVGQIIHSTTLSTLAKVKEVYGSNTTWIRHEGYVLRGATSGVTSNDATKTGGSDDAIVPYHRHYVERQSLAESAGSHSHVFYSQGGGATTWQGWVAQAINGYTPDQSLETWSAGAHTHYISAHNTNYEGTSTTNANIPNYKSVYIWERTE